MVKKQRNKIKPYKTTPYREGCHSQKEYVLPFKDTVGNTALITYCDFINKKGVLVNGHVLFVKWVEDWEYCESLDKHIAQGFNQRQKVREDLQYKNGTFEVGGYEG